MPNINFTGKVVPVPVPITAELDKLPTMQYENIETGEKESYLITITGNQVDVFISVDHFNDEDVERHRNKSLDLARAALDLFNFRSGWGLSLYLDRYIGPDGKPVIIVPGHPELSSLVTFESSAIKSLYHVFAADARLHMALSDLTQAITWPHVAPVNCARAVEGIRTIIAPGKRSAGWPKMNAELNLTEGYTRMITSMSEAPRHGDRVWNGGEPVAEIIRRSWTIMMRYMEWESRGEKPLPEDKFPMLPTAKP